MIARAGVGDRPAAPIVEIGPIPPPYGGVSVHVRRLALLLAASDLRVVVCSDGGDPIPGVEVIRLEKATSRGWLRSGAAGLKARVVHCHEGWHWAPVLLMAAMRGSRVVVTVHSERTMDSMADLPWRFRVSARLLLASPNVRWLAVTARIAERLVERGARAENVRVAPAYLPDREADGCSSELPDELQAFVAAHHPLLTVYGWRVNLTDDGADLYGFDLAIGATAQLLTDMPECGLVVLVPSGEPSAGVEALRRDMDDRRLGDSVCLWTAPLADPTLLWAATDVYLRPTRSDGDAMSVREVLAIGGTVVASECSERPTGVRTFATGDQEALSAEVRAALSPSRRAVRSGSDASSAFAAVAWAYGLSPEESSGIQS